MSRSYHYWALYTVDEMEMIKMSKFAKLATNTNKIVNSGIKG